MSSKDQFLARALNELRDANLSGLESDAIGFVEQYFVNTTVDDSADAGEAASDSESEYSRSSDSESDDDPDVADEPARPLVVVDDFVATDDGGDGAQDLESQRAKARAFDCKCHLVNGGPCSARYTVDEFVHSRSQMMELTSGKSESVKSFRNTSGHT